MHTFAAALVIAALAAGQLQAQEEGDSKALHLMPGTAYIRASFGDDDSRVQNELGLSIGALWYVPFFDAWNPVVEAVWEANRIENPHFVDTPSSSEDFRSLYLLAGRSIGRGHRSFRSCLGAVIRTWSYETRKNDTDWNIALGLAMVLERSVETGVIGGPELTLRFVPGVSVVAWTIGLQVPIGLL